MEGGLSVARQSFAVDLPWPERSLSPNARVHWAKKAKQVKAARALAYWHVMSAGGQPLKGRGEVHVWINAYPPDRRRRDMDNILASCKAYLDGVAQALRVDDARFVLHVRMTDELGAKIRIAVG